MNTYKFQYGTFAHYQQISLSLVFLGSVSFGSYFYLYKEYLQMSLLNTTDCQDGFSTRASSSLGYSFWMMMTSSSLNIMTILILVVGVLRSGKTTLSFGKRNTNESEPVRSKDGPVMMMYQIHMQQQCLSQNNFEHFNKFFDENGAIFYQWEISEIF